VSQVTPVYVLKGHLCCHLFGDVFFLPCIL